MKSILRLIAVVGVLFGLSLAVPVLAQSETADDTGKGLMNAMVFRPLAPGTAIAVQPLDNSDVNMALKADFESALRQRGYRVADGAPVVLNFETRNVIGAWSDAGRRSIIELEGRGGRMGGEDAKARLNLYNSSRGGLLNEGEGETSIVTHGRYRLEVTLDDHAERTRLWQGWAESQLGRYQGRELLAAMVPMMVENLGKTVRRQPFQLP